MGDIDKIPPVSFQISRQMDQEKIDFLSKRVEVSKSIKINKKSNMSFSRILSR